MGKYDIKDAIMLKEIMKQLAAIKAKYPNMYLERIPDDLKDGVEFIEKMVEQNV